MRLKQEHQSLDDVITLQRGFDLPSAKRKEGSVPVVASTGITGYHNEPKVKAPGVVIGRSGSIGGGQYIKRDFWPLNTTLWVKDFKNHNPRFVYYLLKSIDFSRFNAGSGVPTLNRNHIASLKVPKFSNTEEYKIIDILSGYDDLVENNRQRIVLLEESARQLYKEWFIRFRFPGREHVKIIDDVPEGWRQCHLGDAITLQRGFDLPVKNRIEGQVPIYASTEVNGFHNQAKVSAPGVVTGRSGSLGQVQFVHDDFWPLNTTLWVKEFKLVDPLFAYFLLTSLKLENYNGGAAVPTLNRNDVHRIDIVLPTQSLLKQFSEQTEIIFQQIHKLELSNRKLSEARDLLLPKLMSREIVV